jgi:primosomal protein N' (replication factor Y)
MAEFVKVIVDVPTLQTNRPYDYAVPPALQAQVAPGMRVVVPFGKGNRAVQGFIVAVFDQTDYQGTLKPLLRLTDLTPVLNPELLALGQWLAETTFAFQISCFQTMLPSLMRASYSKNVQLIAPDNPLAQQVFQQATVLPYDSFKTPEQQHQLVQLQRQQAIRIQYQVKQRDHAKTVQGVELAQSQAELVVLQQTLGGRAKKQQQLLTYLLEQQPTLPAPITTLAQQAGVSRGVINAAIEKGWLKPTTIAEYRDPTAGEHIARTQPLTLTAEQQSAVQQILTAAQAHENRTFLIEGVTGSGKTEVYLQSIAAVLQQHQTALMLVPEIALTPQMVKRVKGRFGSKVAILHSGLSNGEKYDEWQRIERQEADVVVGARSAIFAPLQHIGLIIMDEEHESSYKQDEMPRYHARDVAQWRSAYHHCPLILGSATPSLESRARAQKNVYQLIRLTQRANQRPLPPVTVVDMKQELKKTQESNFSAPLLEALRRRVVHHEQSVLLLNRRGFSAFVMCRDCGFVLKCPNCDISLTLHMATHSMKCHYCGHEEAIPKICPNCHQRKIRYYGTGTEKVEAELQQCLPEARVIRMDVDTTRRKGAHERLLSAFGRHEGDILLGTQMIAKGLDFPDVTLVGVLNADTSLGLPDFRASERTFQLLTQVSGRAGRADKPGEVIIQTYNPEHYAIRLARQHDYEGFYQREMTLRHQGQYPPYYFTIKLTTSDEDETVAAKKIFELQQTLKPVLSDQAIILGPTPRAIARMKRRYYYQLVIKYRHEPRLMQTLTAILQQNQASGSKAVQVMIDREPLNFI